MPRIKNVAGHLDQHPDGRPFPFGDVAEVKSLGPYESRIDEGTVLVLDDDEQSPPTKEKA